MGSNVHSLPDQILCFDTAIDAEKFCKEKSAIFIVLPEEDQAKYFMVSLIIQNLYREILTVADEYGEDFQTVLCSSQTSLVPVRRFNLLS